MKRNANKPGGFTLIELSIVLVIIGLIVGGVLVGRNLIFQAEARSIMTDTEAFNTAVYTFRTKHNCLPGDCVNATQYLGTSSSGCPTGNGTTGTCNGDDSGKVDGLYTSGTAYGGTAPNQETFLFWQHLSLTGLIAGKFTGIAGIAHARQSLIGTNVPTSRIRGAGYSVYWGQHPGAGGRFPALGHMYQIGTQPGRFGPNYETDGLFLTTAEALAIDTKYDDALPGKGKMQTIFDSSISPCATTTSVDTAIYDLTQTSYQCSFRIQANF